MWVWTADFQASKIAFRISQKNNLRLPNKHKAHLNSTSWKSLEASLFGASGVPHVCVVKSRDMSVMCRLIKTWWLVSNLLSRGPLWQPAAHLPAASSACKVIYSWLPPFMYCLIFISTPLSARFRTPEEILCFADKMQWQPSPSLKRVPECLTVPEPGRQGKVEGICKQAAHWI